MDRRMGDSIHCTLHIWCRVLKVDKNSHHPHTHKVKYHTVKQSANFYSTLPKTDCVQHVATKNKDFREKHFTQECHSVSCWWSRECNKPAWYSLTEPKISMKYYTLLLSQHLLPVIYQVSGEFIYQRGIALQHTGHASFFTSMFHKVVYWHACGVVGCLLQTSRHHTREIIFKIGQYLVNIRTRIWCCPFPHGVFLLL